MRGRNEDMQDIRTILIMGAGTMGTAIAQAVSRRGYDVILVDRDESLLQRARTMLDTNVATMVKEGLCSDSERDSVFAHTTFGLEADLPALGPKADLVIESVFENPDVKRAVYEKLDTCCRADCIFCSNTSASNVFEIARVSNPQRFLITHWFNPAYLMELVEIVRGPESSDEVTARVEGLLTALGKKPCVLNQYVPGFIVNRIANAICREAGYMITQGWTTARDIETALRSTSGVRYAFEGPLALNDVVGWDLIEQGCRDVYPSLCNDTDTSAYAKALVEAGDLGVKTGRGALSYEGIDPNAFMAERSGKIIKMYRAIQEL